MNTSKHHDELYEILSQSAKNISDGNFTAEIVRQHLAKQQQPAQPFIHGDGLLLTLATASVLGSVYCMYVLLNRFNATTEFTLPAEYKPLACLVLISTVGMLYRYFMERLVFRQSATR